MSLPASDNFTYSNGQLSTVSSGAWADSSSTQKVQVASNAATYDSVAGNCLAYWATDAFANDHYSQATLTGTGYPGLAVRVMASDNGYVAFNTGVPPGNFAIQKDVAGTRTNLATWNFTSGHVGYFSAVGTTLEMKDAGVSIGTLTDSTFASGSAGIFLYNGGSATVDGWTGDNIGGATSKLRRNSSLNGLGSSGPFFHDPLSKPDTSIHARAA